MQKRADFWELFKLLNGESCYLPPFRRLHAPAVPPPAMSRAKVRISNLICHVCITCQYTCIHVSPPCILHLLGLAYVCVCVSVCVSAWERGRVCVCSPARVCVKSACACVHAYISACACVHAYIIVHTCAPAVPRSILKVFTIQITISSCILIKISVCMLINISVCILMHTSLWVLIHIHLHAHKDIHIFMCHNQSRDPIFFCGLDTLHYTHTSTYTHIHNHTHTHTHIHTNLIYREPPRVPTSLTNTPCTP